MSKTVIILSGVSGSGKTYYTDKLIVDAFKKQINCGLYSADSFFTRDNEYKFNPNDIGLAHADCFARYMEAVIHGSEELIIIDNTNTTSIEIAPYVLGANAFGYEHKIVEININWHTDLHYCIERNVHNVDEQTIIDQYQNMTSRKLPPWWNVETIHATF